MLIKIVVGVLVVISLFLGYISTREGRFHFERSGIIQAPAEKIFPYISQFKLGEQWSPYEKVDPQMKKRFVGEDGNEGAVMEFDGNSEAGTGRLKILKIVPNQSVQIRLIMTKPLPADHLIDYTLTPEGDATRFTWSMHGDGGFFGKLISFFIDCDAMVGGQFEAGIKNLKAVVESSSTTSQPEAVH